MPRPPPDLIDRVIARNIRFHRLRRGLTLTELAAALGVTYQQLQKYEAGFNKIAASRLYLAAQILRVPFAVFFEL